MVGFSGRWLTSSAGVYLHRITVAVVPLFLEFSGKNHINGPIQVGTHYANDLTAFVVPVPSI